MTTASARWCRPTTTLREFTPSLSFSYRTSNEDRNRRVALDKARQAGPSKLDKALALPVLSDRARVVGGLDVYTVAPKSNITGAPAARQPGQGGEAAFKKLKARHATKASGRR
jgi:hypothetical protein